MCWVKEMDLSGKWAEPKNEIWVHCDNIVQAERLNKPIIRHQFATEFILEKDKGWEKGEERVLGFHLLEFNERRRQKLSKNLVYVSCHTFL
nr:arginine--tRNA ligase, chloroplastic/mitochondrial [Tanacetum cinerariifolium]